MFSIMLNMRSTRDAIVEAAMACFARDGFGVALRPIADEAGVSAALIVHHFGSKQGLRDAVDDHVLGVVEEKLRLYNEQGFDAAVALVMPMMEQGVLPRYLARVLAEQSDAGRRLFQQFVDVTEKALVDLDLGDRRMTAALLCTHSLGMMLMVDSVNEAVGVDVFSAAGLPRYAAAAFDVYKGKVAELLPS
jgi:AcrR family transcriptional regulator